MAAVAGTSSSQWRTRRHRVFQSVFQTESAPSQSLPHANQPSSSAATSSFPAGPPASQPIFAQHHVSKPPSSAPHVDAQLERAWNLVTTKLQPPADFSDQDLDEDPVLPPFASAAEQAEFNAALLLLVQPGRVQRSHAVVSEYDLLPWFGHQARAHYVQYVIPRLADLSRGLSTTGHRNDVFAGCMAVIRNVIKTLRAAEHHYVPRLSAIVAACHPASPLGESDRIAKKSMARFTRDMQALVSNSFDTVIKPLTIVLELHVAEALEVPNARAKTVSRLDPAHPIPPETSLIALVQVLDEAGLAGERFQVLFAEIMDKTMTQYINQTYSQVWKSPSKPADNGLSRSTAKSTNISHPSWCISSLCDWVENQFGRVSLLVLSNVQRGTPRPNTVSLADVQQWKEIAIGRLAALRISELFDIVLQWPASKGALDDLKASVTSPKRRWELTTAFSTALQKRLLHPARSTLDILRFYVSMIRTFHALDHSKVLLGRAIPSLQLYLVQREDAVRMVVKGLLASPEEVEQAQKAPSSTSDIDAEGGSRRASNKLVELAVLLNDPDQERRMDVDEEDLDWDDMEWVPDPVDAGVNYKRPRSEDVIGTLINTLGSEEVFIKEFQTIISEHLLSTQTIFSQEQKLLGLLKRRFGEASIQNCEVMIKDIYDSRRVDTQIRRIEFGQPPQPFGAFGTSGAPSVFTELGKPSTTEEQAEAQVSYHARILSRHYWPNIVQETFQLPSPVAEVQEKYESGYEKLKSARKLTWLQQLGQATVELVLEDRTVTVDCKTFEAAVIYAFHRDEEDEEDVEIGHVPFRLSVQDLQKKLEMDEELVVQAVDFWLSEQVLIRYSTDPDTYMVLERKDSPPTRPELHPSVSAPAALEGEHEQFGMPPKPTGVKRAGTTSAMDAKENERRAIYWQFIVGMLTNSMATMPLSQMAMMLRMVIPDGLPWSDQELQEFLMEKVALGELEVAGGKYRLAKK